jgi:hypothetical protein
MLILLFTWVCSSLAFALALLGAAARPAPRSNEEITSSARPAMLPLSGVVSERAETKAAPTEAALASPCRAA